MKYVNGLSYSGLLLCLLGVSCAVAADSPSYVILKPKVESSLRIAVLVPDTTETFASRYDNQSTHIGIAQGLIERDLLDSGFSLVSLDSPHTMNQLPSRAQALAAAKAASADCLIFGQANAREILSSESTTISGNQLDAEWDAEARSSRWSEGRSFGIETPESTFSGGETVSRESAQEQQFGQIRERGGSINRPERTAIVSVQVIRTQDGQIIAAEQGSSSGAARSRQQGLQGAITEATKRLLRYLVPQLEDLRREQANQQPSGIISLE